MPAGPPSPQFASEIPDPRATAQFPPPRAGTPEWFVGKARGAVAWAWEPRHRWLILAAFLAAVVNTALMAGYGDGGLYYSGSFEGVYTPLDLLYQLHPDYLLVSLCVALSLGNIYVGFYLWVLVSSFLAAFLCSVLARELFRYTLSSEDALRVAVLAGLLYLFCPSVISWHYVSVIDEIFTSTIGLFAVLYLLVRLLHVTTDGRSAFRWRDALYLGIAMGLSTPLYFPDDVRLFGLELLLLAGIGLLAWLLRRHAHIHGPALRTSLVRVMVAALPIALVVLGYEFSLFWVSLHGSWSNIDIVAGITNQRITITTSDSFPNSVRLLGWIYFPRMPYFGQLEGVNVVSALTFAWPVLALIAAPLLFLAHKGKGSWPVILLVLLAIFSVAWETGSNPPFAGLNAFIQNHIPYGRSILPTDRLSLWFLSKLYPILAALALVIVYRWALQAVDGSPPSVPGPYPTGWGGPSYAPGGPRLPPPDPWGPGDPGPSSGWSTRRWSGASARGVWPGPPPGAPRRRPSYTASPRERQLHRLLVSTDLALVMVLLIGGTAPLFDGSAYLNGPETGAYVVPWDYEQAASVIHANGADPTVLLLPETTSFIDTSWGYGGASAFYNNLLYPSKVLDPAWYGAYAVRIPSIASAYANASTPILPGTVGPPVGAPWTSTNVTGISAYAIHFHTPVGLNMSRVEWLQVTVHDTQPAYVENITTHGQGFRIAVGGTGAPYTFYPLKNESGMNVVQDANGTLTATFLLGGLNGPNLNYTSVNELTFVTLANQTTPLNLTDLTVRESGYSIISPIWLSDMQQDEVTYVLVDNSLTKGQLQSPAYMNVELATLVDDNHLGEVFSGPDVDLYRYYSA